MGILENIIGTKEQNETAQKMLDKQASEGGKLAKFLGGNPDTAKEKKESQGKAMMEAGSRLLERPIEKAKGGKVSSASKRADGCAVKGKTKGRIV